VLDRALRRAHPGLGRAAPARVRRHAESRAHGGMDTLPAHRAAAPARLPGVGGRRVSPDPARRRSHASPGHDLVPAFPLARRVLEAVVRLHHPSHSPAGPRAHPRRGRGGSMRIVIPGGSGQVGTALARDLWTRGHDVVVLSRRRIETPWRNALWDGATLDSWTREIDGAGAVINLAGRSVRCRYGAENRREILDSRVHSTRVVGEAIGPA